jgi:hypothetical protein
LQARTDKNTLQVGIQRHPKLYDPAESLTAMHNHPIMLPLSNTDRWALQLPGLKTIVAIMPDGHMSAIRLTDRARMFMDMFHPLNETHVDEPTWFERTILRINQKSAVP